SEADCSATTVSADDSHLVTGDLAIPDRQLDLTLAAVRHFSRGPGAIELVDVGDDPAAAEIVRTRRFELEVEVLGWGDPGELFTHLVDAGEVAARCQPLDVVGQEPVQQLAFARVRDRREHREELPCDLDVVSAHGRVPVDARRRRRRSATAATTTA